MVPLEDRSVPAVSGLVFHDYNANGVFETTGVLANNGTGSIATAVDYGVPGVTVTAFNASNVPVSTTTTGADGRYVLRLNTGGIFRVEFTGLPAQVSFGPTGGQTNSSVQFVDADATNVNLAVLRASDFSPNNPTIVTSEYVFAGSAPGNPFSSNSVLVSFPASAGSAQGDPNIAAYQNPNTHELSVPQSQIGSTWGLAYDNTRNLVYSAAFLKRHTGFGPSGPGAIYQSNVTGTTASLYANLNSIFGDSPAGNLNDVFRDRNNNPVSFLRDYTDEVSWARDGLVRFVDVDGITRDLGWDAVGKLSLGGLDTNDDSSRMYTVALGDRQLYSLPTTGALNTSTVQRFSLPIPSDVTGRTARNPLGDLRPFAVEYHRGIVYVGAVNSAESTQNRSDLRAYVFAFDPVRGAFVNANRQTTTTEAVFVANLNYDRGFVHMAGEGNPNFPNQIAPPDAAEWNPWSPTIKNVAQQPFAIGRSVYPQPMLTGLSFDAEGNMVLGLRDRSGDQFGRLTAEDPLNPNAFNFFGITGGDTLRAFINTPFNLDLVAASTTQAISGWTLESNGRGPAGQGQAPQNSGQGPGGGEFYFDDNLPRDSSLPPIGVINEHEEVSVGGVLHLPGTTQLLSTAFDPVHLAGRVNTGGVRWYDNQTGITTKQYELYETSIAPGAPTFAKANGVGDLIAITAPPPIEIGNFIWNDLNGNGIQEPGEPAAAGVDITLCEAGPDGQFGTGDDVALGTARTDANGNYYFSSGAGTSTANRLTGLNLQPNTQYQLKIATSQSALARKQATVGNAAPGANGAAIDSDGTNAAGNILVNVTTGGVGQSNHTFDVGLVDVPLVSIGNFVWNDVNNNGTADVGEAGLGGVTVNLYAADGVTLVATMNTSAAGNYQFDNLAPGSYIVEILPPTGFISSSGNPISRSGPFEPGVVGNLNNQDHGTTQANGTIRAAVVALSPPGSPLNPDSTGTRANNANFTVDFGLYQTQSVGNFVWSDTNNNGKLDTGETGVGNVSVNLLDSAGTVLASTTTNAGGNYLFTDLSPGSYRVRITPPVGFSTSTGRLGSSSGPYEPGVSGTQDDEDHGSANGANIITAPFTLGNPGSNPDSGGLANLRQDFGLIRALSLGNFVWEDANNNGKFDLAEAALPGVSITLLNSAGNVVETTTTNGLGEYLFSNLVDGQYTIRVVTPAGYTSSTGVNGSLSGPFEPAAQTTNNNEDHGTAVNAVAESVVTLAPAGSTANPDNDGTANLRQDFGFYRPLSVGNLVWLDTNNNGIREAAEQGVPNVAVTLRDGSGAIVGSTTTSVTGNYLFTNLAPGAYTVEIGRPGNLRSSTGQGLTSDLTGPFEVTAGDQLRENPNDNEDKGTTLSGGGVIAARAFTLFGPGSNPDQSGSANLRQDFGLWDGVVPPVPPPPTSPSASVSGFVYRDTFEANGLRQPANGETGIPGVTVRLFQNGQELRSTTTDSNGFYIFEGLEPGIYSIFETQPGGFNDGLDTVGTLGGSNPQNDVLTVTLQPNQRGDEYNFGEVLPPVVPPPPILPASVSGFVYRDTFQANGVRQPANGEAGISGVAITLQQNGQIVARATTDRTGFYKFENLQPGAYTIIERQPAAFIDGLDTVGSLGGSVSSNDILAVTLASGQDGVEYNFGEVIAAQLPPSPPPPLVVPGDDPTKRNFLGSSTNGTAAVVSQPSTSPPISRGSVNPSFSQPLNQANPRFVVTSGGAGSLPEVRVFDYSSGSERYRIMAYETSFTGGVRTATADVDGDTIEDIIIGTGVGGGPRIRVFSGANGQQIRDYFAFEPTFRGGIFVAGGDMTGDGLAEVIVGAEVGGGPRITAFNGADGSEVANFFAFDSAQRGGTRIAAGDFNADGRADIVATTGEGVPTRLRIFNGVNITNILQDYAPFENRFTGGANIAVGDLNRDGVPDIITGAETGGGPRVQNFDGRTGQPINSYFAFEQNYTGGIRVAAQDINDDGTAEIIVGSGLGRTAETRIFSPNGETVLDTFFPIDTAGGIYVG